MLFYLVLAAFQIIPLREVATEIANGGMYLVAAIIVFGVLSVL